MKDKTYYTFTLGIDISKKRLDCCLNRQNKPIWEGSVDNTKDGLANLDKKVKYLGIEKTALLICCENTGIYTEPLKYFTENHNYNLWIGMPFSIKQSQGLVRGKTDRADAKRIAQYAYRYIDQYRLWHPPHASIRELKKLWGIRKTLLKVRKQIKQQLGEIAVMVSKKARMDIENYYCHTLTSLTKDMERVTEEIACTISSNEVLKTLHNTITSVDGIGTVTATLLIIVTEGFQKICDPKKLACYAGIVPFAHNSGTSIRRRERVSHFANKELKRALHICALSSVRGNNPFADYHRRKKEEGKHNMSVLNAVRNKLLRTVCACVRKCEAYEKNYTEHKPSNEIKESSEHPLTPPSKDEKDTGDKNIVNHNC